MSHDSEHDAPDSRGMTADEKRHDQLTRAPKSDETDAAPRITTEERPDGVTRIDVADTAKVRPGGGESQAQG
ncbi:hypothetical protein [Frigoribacterium endophyticum]|uniref:hypothetical protein n=1 Tax=Frigoribacterium endophyticum TaxID=1522176 RepID=UPI001421E9BA|nr:hypothetical protein [Frigoribacterium endophyticum]NII51747.1 oligoribonuclease NrnB/cAMP/cGMP phosphodiesterase (DHH superfamily) [Frigoribacterium endophyticum]